MFDGFYNAAYESPQLRTARSIFDLNYNKLQLTYLDSLLEPRVKATEIRGFAGKMSIHLDLTTLK